MKEKVTEMQGELRDSAGKVWLAGLGALTVAAEEGSKLFKNLVEKGKEFEDQDKPAVDNLKKTMDSAKGRAGDVVSRFEDVFNDKVALALQKLGVPTREEIHQLTKRVDALMEALEKLDKTEDTNTAE